jgi:4-amino-4-deoxy-L-arabinose transferase-like glycosyltransferase
LPPSPDSNINQFLMNSNPIRPFRPFRPFQLIRPWLLLLLVLAVAGLLFFPRLGSRSLWGSEGRWAEVAREMGQSGNYFWPTINGEVYYDKPLLSYWLVAAAGTLTGHLNETATRLPSAIAGLAGVLLVMLLAGKLYDRRTALLSGVILATGYSYVFHARLASADMETVIGVLAVLTLFVYHEHRHEKRPTGWWVVELWLLMAVTSLTKGLIGFALPLFILGCDSLFSDGWRTVRERIMRGPLSARAAWLIERGRWVLNWKTVPALAVAGLVYVLPFVISSARMHSEAGLVMVFRENIVRFFEPFDHRGPIYLYTYMIFLLAAPWSLFLPAALVHLHSTPSSRQDRFVLAYFWATFLFFTISGSRRWYYLLPILPAVAIVISRLFITGWDALHRRVRRLMQVGFLLIAVVVVAAGIVVLLPAAARPLAIRDLPEFPARGLFFVLWGLELAALISAFRLWHRGAMAWPTAVVASCSLLFYFVCALPAIEQYRGEKRFAHAVRTALHGDYSSLVLYRVTGAAGLLFYLGTEAPIPNYHDGQAVKTHIETTPHVMMISRNAEAAALSIPGTVVVRERDFPWEQPRELENKLVLWSVETPP